MDLFLQCGLPVPIEREAFGLGALYSNCLVARYAFVGLGDLPSNCSVSAGLLLQTAARPRHLEAEAVDSWSLFLLGPFSSSSNLRIR